MPSHVTGVTGNTLSPGNVPFAYNSTGRLTSSATPFAHPLAEIVPGRIKTSIRDRLHEELAKFNFLTMPLPMRVVRNWCQLPSPRYNSTPSMATQIKAFPISLS